MPAEKMQRKFLNEFIYVQNAVFKVLFYFVVGL